MCYFMLITSLVTFLISFSSKVNSETITITSSGQDDLLELLYTEKVLIDSLRHYIETQEQSLNELKRKTRTIKDMHESVSEDREKYLNNPINSIHTLKRFTSDWRELKNEAIQFLDTKGLTSDITQQKQQLSFPTDDDYDSALGNLLLIQDMFKLEPQRLSIGEVSGVKLGSEMSWSDCLEIGLKSLKKGYQTYAKFWMETALDKLPSVLPLTNSSTKELNGEEVPDGKLISTSIQRDEYSVKARIEVLKAFLNMEYKAGNLDKALSIAIEMLELNPKQKSVLKAIQQIKDDKRKRRFGNKNIEESSTPQQNANKKTDEELLIEDICRATTNKQDQIHSIDISSSSSSHPSCVLATHNLNWLILQPLQVELLNLDPFIAIYHNVLSDTQSKVLKEFIAENADDIAPANDDGNDNGSSLHLTKIGKKKMHQFNEKLHYVTGHARDALNKNQWQVNRYNFENLMKLETTSVDVNVNDGKRQAGILFNMQQPLLGGSIIFPQLELSVTLPEQSLLYWTALNEFGCDDYRTKYHVCPVIGGTQITAFTYVSRL